VSKEATAGEIWQTLSKLNVDEHTEDRNGLSYLSWAWAWGIMMDNYPTMKVTWHGDGEHLDHIVYPGGTAAVSCTVSIGSVSQHMWLPVMDYRHKAIANPDARSISDAKMRCMVKCFALFGLGHYIYAGEDLPPGENKKAEKNNSAPAKARKSAAKPKPKAKPKAKAEPELTEPTQENGDEVYAQEMLRTVKSLANRLNKAGWEPDADFKKRVKDAVQAADVDELKAVLHDMEAVGNPALQLQGEIQ
tara:strand:+ start:2378 stop:3118 length:741 start_codon:yes stop_codon:yes gene_type:complete